MTELFGAGWIATPQEIIHSAQLFAWVHTIPLVLWTQRHLFKQPRHQAIRQHHRQQHAGSPFDCSTGACATL